jgi:AcrR family transcriptional regulator
MQARPRTSLATTVTGGRAVRPSSEEIDERILDVAAGVFAQFGYAQASVQQIADETGYSKTGLLHRFGSKEQLRDAVRESCLAAFADAIGSPRTRKAGPARDREIVTALVDLAMVRPGFIALLLSGMTELTADDTAWVHHEARALVDVGFGMDDATPLSRQIRVIGCLATLGVGVGVTATREFPAHEVRVELEAACRAVLGV